MKNSLKHYVSIITITAILLTGCGSRQENQTESETIGTVEASETVATTTTTSQVIVDTEFTANDLDVGYEDSTATHITFDGSNIEVSGDSATYKDGIVTISDEGTYVITGALEDGQIVVDAKDTDKVQLVLNGVSITCSDYAPIYIKNADKTFITLVENTVNTLTDGSAYVQTDDNTVDGVIFSTTDLTINGDGTLNINGNFKHGIASKDDLVITGGTFNITAVKDALNGKDCVKIKDGTFILSATTGNGIQSKNGDDTTKGYVYIGGGDITVIKCMEGIEGTAIIIEDGKVNVTAEDDGINASSGASNEAETLATEVEPIKMPNETTSEATNKATNETPNEARQGGFDGGFGGGGNAFEVDTNCYISITGGTIIVDALGDGIDSNGNLYISGGTTYVSGPTNSGNGALDYNGTAEISGGTVVVAGSTGMAQGFSETSSQYSLLYNLTTESEAGTEIKLTDKDGNVVASFTPNKQFQSVVISTKDLTKDETYTLTCGEQKAEIVLSSVVTSNGQQGMGGQGMGGQGMDGQGMDGQGMDGQGTKGQGGRGGQPGKNGMVKPGEDNTTEITETTESN